MHALPSGEWLEIWFRNECRSVIGVTNWGSFSYGRWWKGLALQYTIPGIAQGAAVDDDALYSYAELEHEAAGTCRQPLETARSIARLAPTRHPPTSCLHRLCSHHRRWCHPPPLDVPLSGPTLAVGPWRIPLLPQPLQSAEEAPHVHICLAKAKAFGIKRIVHRTAIPFADLIGRRTTITWVQD